MLKKKGGGITVSLQRLNLYKILRVLNSKTSSSNDSRSISKGKIYRQILYWQNYVVKIKCSNRKFQSLSQYKNGDILPYYKCIQDFNT